MKPAKQPHAKLFPLRLPKSLKAAAQLMAEQNGVSLNYFISLAIAEKVERIEQEKAPPKKNKRA
jgi:predicted HicB family RNase H-like nuclease